MPLNKNKTKQTNQKERKLLGLFQGSQKALEHVGVTGALETVPKRSERRLE